MESGLLDALFSHAPVGLAYWGDDLRYRRINAAIAAINGASPEGHLGRRPAEVLGPLGRQVEELLAEVLETGQAITGIAHSGETPAAPGVTRHWVASYYPITASTGERGVGALVEEVTAQRQASEQAREARREARTASRLIDAVFTAAPVGLAFWSPDLRFRRVNEAFAALNEHSVQEHIDRPLEEVLGPYAGEVRDLLTRVMADREPILDQEFTARSAAGDEQAVHWEGSFFPVVGRHGELEGAAVVVRDVSARHAEQAERSRLFKEAVIARAQAEAAQARAELLQQEAEEARAAVDAAYRRADFLLAAGQRMAASLDYEQTLQEVATAAVPAIADWCLISLKQPDGRIETVAVEHADEEKARWARELARRNPARPDTPIGSAHAIRTGEVQLVSELPDELLVEVAADEDVLRALRRLAPRSVLAVPLQTADRILGAISLVMADSGRSFGEQDVAMARSLASRAGLHIRNAQLFAERTEIARTLQSSLLPRRLPHVPGLEIAARYLAAGDQNEVGGDFYDVFESADGVWTALIGDVAGKGAGAAAVTSLTRHTLRAAAMRSSDPRENLRLLNDALLADADITRFCTVAYARVAPGDGSTAVRFGSGGHLPPLVLRHGGEVEAIELDGTLIGAVADPRIDIVDTVLRPGDLLLMYTDGVTEVRRTDLEEGERSLRRLLADLAGAPAEAVVAEVQRAAVALQDGHPRDDIALLALRMP